MNKYYNENVLEVLKRHKIKVVQDLSTDRFFRMIGKIGNRKIIFKLRRSKKGVTKENFLNEVFADKVLKAQKPPKNNFRHRRVIDYCLDYPQWIIFEYCVSKTAGEQWFFSEDFYKSISPEKIFNALKFWQEDITAFLSGKEFLSSGIFKKNNFASIISKFLERSDAYFEKYLKKRKNVKQVYFKKDRRKILQLLKKQKKIIVANNNYICHTDINPQNILIDKGDIIIIDFEKVHYDIPYFDFAFIWFACWNNLAWRKKLYGLLLEDAENKKRFKILFNISILRFLPHILTLISPKKNKDFKKALFLFRRDYKRAVNYLDSVNIN